MTGNEPFVGGVPMVKIDGTKIRQLREEKGLTQLYLATAVGVTTDTISRWENRKYPTIKKENALKLAEALEADVEAILDVEEAVDAKEIQGEDEQSSPPSQPEVAAAPPIEHKRKQPLLLGAALVVLTGLSLLWFRHEPQTEKIAARRVLPGHTVAGGVFPVVVIISKDRDSNDSFILKEKIPSGSEAVEIQNGELLNSSPKKELKWIVKQKQTDSSIAYMVKANQSLKNGEILLFNGEVTHKSLRGASQNVTGPNRVAIAPYHWADQNMDGRIDDEEMLTVYDDFGDLHALPVNVDLIEEIWFGSGYTWSAETHEFVIQP